MHFEPGDLIDDKYRIVRTIGAGGMGAVYEGENVRIGRRVAIKVMHGEASKVPDLRRRFAREARVAAKIGSSNICDVLDLGDLPDGSSYLVMEFLVGQSLEDRMNARGRMPAHEIAPLVLQLLDGLAAMHGAGVVHRDLKPANIFLTSPNVRTTGGHEIVKILDFGISKFQSQMDEAGQTATGALMGTPLYMSPEQSRGASDLDGRSDLYCVGVILYRALAGEHCFEAANIPQLLFKTAMEAPIPLLPRVSEGDRTFVPIVEKAMAKAPGDRYQSARELRDAIEEWLMAEHPMVALPPAPVHFEGVVSGASGSYPNLLPGVPAITPHVVGTAAPAASAGSTAHAWEKKGPEDSDVSALAISVSSGGRPSSALAVPPTVATGAPVPAAPVPPLNESRESVVPAGPAPAVSAVTPPPKPSSPMRFVAAGLGVALLIAGVAVGVRRSGAKDGPPPPPVATAPETLPSLASASPSAPPTLDPAKTAKVEPAPSPSASAPDGPSSALPPGKVVPTGPWRGPAKASATPSASVASTPPPTPEPSSSTKPGRKIRTEL